MPSPIKYVLGIPHNSLKHEIEKLGIEGFRAGQIAHWIYKKGVFDYFAMKNLSQSLQQKLHALLPVGLPEIQDKQISEDGTIKYRFNKQNRYYDAVYIPHVAGSKTNTLCISSQAGCALGCKFCYTATLGSGPNLETHEIVGQYCAVWNDLGLPQTAAEGKITNIVYMGMGEPLLNMNHVLASIDIFSQQTMLDISTRRITVSTVGIIPGIKELGDKTSVQLAISLHAPYQALRTEIMPINKKYKLDDLIQALKDFPLPKRRRITIEYIMLDNVNDQKEHAQALHRLLSGLKVKINLIALNEHDYTRYKASQPSTIEAFLQVLHDKNLTAVLRKSRGQEVSAACGMLGEAHQIKDCGIPT